MVNKVILIGHLGSDPEVRALETGVKMARLKIATNERISNSATGERREHTEWHSILLWRGQADFAEKYLRKGNQVYIEGRIRSSEWTEAATGIKRHSIEIIADEIRQLGGAAMRRTEIPTEMQGETQGETENRLAQSETQSPNRAGKSSGQSNQSDNSITSAQTEQSAQPASAGQQTPSKAPKALKDVDDLPF